MESNSDAKRGWVRFIWYHLPLIIYSAMIIVVSSIPNLRTPELQVIAFDKMAHLFEYALLAYLAFRSFSNLMAVAQVRRAFLLAAVFVSGLAIFDEWFQSMIPGRFSSGWDVLADLIGALLVLSFFAVRRYRLGRRAGDAKHRQ
jgi:VanZ family protein